MFKLFFISSKSGHSYIRYKNFMSILPLPLLYDERNFQYRLFQNSIFLNGFPHFQLQPLFLYYIILLSEKSVKF